VCERERQREKGNALLSITSTNFKNQRLKIFMQ
jgi:hypothetical protein